MTILLLILSPRPTTYLHLRANRRRTLLILVVWIPFWKHFIQKQMIAFVHSLRHVFEEQVVVFVDESLNIISDLGTRSHAFTLVLHLVEFV